MAFDHKKFLADRIAKKPIGPDEMADHDTYAALYTLSMTPSLYKSIMALNTIEFTRLTTKTQAKVMEAFNGKKLSTGYLRAQPSEIAAANKKREMVMTVFETSSSSADSMILNDEVDTQLVADLYAYKMTGLVPEDKKSAKRKK